MLFPKLRIRFADFPYLHCVYGLKASNLGDRMRLFGTAADEGSASENSLGFSMKTMGAPWVVKPGGYGANVHRFAG